MNSTLRLLLGAIGLFIILVGLIFGILLLTEPVEDKMVVKTIEGDQVLATQLIQEKQREIDQLKSALDSLKREYTQVIAYRDSIQGQIDFKDNLIAQYKRSVESLNQELAEKQKNTLSIKELAKTYESMKIEELRSIFTKLDDQTILLIYENVNPRNRKNILMALNAARAANITQKLVKTSAGSSS